MGGGTLGAYAPHALLDEAGCEEAWLAIADMIDMRMPFTLGHSRGGGEGRGAAAGYRAQDRRQPYPEPLQQDRRTTRAGAALYALERGLLGRDNLAA